MSSEKFMRVANSSVSWAAIFSGVFVAFLTYLGLVALGLALGGSSIQDSAQNMDTIKNLGIGASLWTVVAMVLSICVGSFVSGRVAGPIPLRVGRTQGAVIASLFFLFLITQAGLIVGGLGVGVTNVISSVTGNTMSAMTSAAGERVIEDAIGDLNLKEPASDVVKGVATRLTSGDDRAAIAYLAHQTGMNPTQANERYLAFKSKFLDMSRQAANTTAQALKYFGFTLFITIVLGTLGAVACGSLAAMYNLQKPVSKLDAKALSRAYVGASA